MRSNECKEFNVNNSNTIDLSGESDNSNSNSGLDKHALSKTPDSTPRAQPKREVATSVAEHAGRRSIKVTKTYSVCRTCACFGAATVVFSSLL